MSGEFEPIINPWIFYLADLVNNFNGMLTIGFIVLTCIAGGALWRWLSAIDDYDTSGRYSDKEFLQEVIDRYRAALKRISIALAVCGIALAVCGIAIIVVPSEKTIYKMLIAKQITPHNLQVAGESVDKLVDKSVEKILKLIDGGADTIKGEKK